ncbi:MAG: hypothetical protein RMJ56_14585 [Gemmataceae bacterium]|nr:hypothetical protein [Gemmata sp.]MDW8198821.1 hypothetical protein [Gemmataceae bacterium]
MNRRLSGRWARRVVWGTLVAVAAIGCNPLNIAAFMFARDEKIDAPYPLAFDKDHPKKDKDEVVVVLLPHLAPGTPRELITADRDLADKLARLLPELSKHNKDKPKIRVVPPAEVDKFKLRNPNWKQMTAGEIGEKLHADFVLEIELSNMRLYQPNTGSQVKIYEGRAEVTVYIYEIGPNGGEFKDRYPLTFAHPKDMILRDASLLSEATFKQEYIENLAKAIAHMHVDHKASTHMLTSR